MSRHWSQTCRQLLGREKTVCHEQEDLLVLGYDSTPGIHHLPTLLSTRPALKKCGQPWRSPSEGLAIVPRVRGQASPAAASLLRGGWSCA